MNAHERFPWSRPFNGRVELGKRLGIPEPGLLLATQRGMGIRTHAVFVFPLEDFWSYATGLRSACFAIGGPWVILWGEPTCLKCRAILRRFDDLHGAAASPSKSRNLPATKGGS